MKKQCPECPTMFGPKPYPDCNGLNMSAWNSQTYCSKSCSSAANARQQGHMVKVRERHRRMCRSRLAAAVKLFLYTNPKRVDITGNMN